MSSQPIVQLNFNTFTVDVPFLTTFCISFWKRVHNSKKIAVCKVCLFDLTVGYVDMTTYTLRKYYYIIERVSIFY